MDPFNPAPGEDPECCDPCADEPGDGLSPRDAEMLVSIGPELDAAVASVNGVLDELIESAAAELDEARAAVDTVVWELAGGVDVTLTDAETAVVKCIQRMVSDVEKVQNGYLDEMYGAGINAPHSVGRMREMLDGNPIDIAVDSVPAIAQWLVSISGVPQPTPMPHEPPPPGWTVLDPIPYPVPTPGPVPSPPLYPPYPPPEPPLPNPVPDEYPWAPPTPPLPQPQPSGWTTIPPRAPQPVPGGHPTCPPVHVTVTVPPISLLAPPPVVIHHQEGDEPPYPPPPASPPGTSPPAVPPSAPASPSAPPTPAIPRTPLPTDPTLDAAFNMREWLRVNKLEPSRVNRELIDWNNLNICNSLEQQISRWVRSGSPEGPDAAANEQIRKAMQWRADNEKSVAGKILADTRKFLQEEVGPVVRDVIGKVSEITGAGEIAQEALNILGPKGAGNLHQAMIYGSRLAIASVAQARTGLPITYLFQPDQYVYQYLNPQYLPSPTETTAAYLTNQIGLGTWQCWQQANGILPEPAKLVMQSSQTKPGVQECIQLYYRGLISADELRLRCRENGVLDSKFTQEWSELYKQLPSMVELLRYMIRDSADEEVVKRYRYDEGFEQKFGAQIKQWAAAQGVMPEVFKYTWRAHWEIPSNTALYSMFHRLRPDRAEVEKFQASYPNTQPGSENWQKLDGPPIVTREDIKTAMQVNDIAPGWVDALLAVSYNPITRTDAVRAFQIGAFTEERLNTAMLDVGYSPEDATTLVNFYKQNKAVRQSNMTGTWTIRKIVRYFKAGSITRPEASEYMKPLQPLQIEIDKILNAAEAELKADQRARDIRALRTGYLYGEYSTEQAGQLLTGYGLEPAQVARLLIAWQTDRDGRHKQPAVKELTAWMVQGLITSNECFDRIRNLGYKKADAEKIVELAVMKADAKGEMTAEEAGGIFEAAIENARQARLASEQTLEKRMRALTREGTRVMLELNKRREGTGQPPLPDVILTPPR